MAALPTELIIEIMSRLPVKSLLCFKTVCKFWNNLIKSPNFIKLHLNQAIISNSDRYLLRWSGYSSLYTAKIDLNLHPKDLYFSKLNLPFETHDQISLVGSCNGIVCITNSFQNNFFSYKPPNDVFLYNPLTNSHRKIPASRIRNPKKCDSIIYGFGYDSKNDDYKVLKISQKLESTFLTTAMVYSLKSNRWRSVNLEGIESDVVFDCHKGVLVNEALHYMVNTVKLDSNSFSEYIYRFDFGTDSFSVMESPVSNDQFMGKGKYTYGRIKVSSDSKYTLVRCVHKSFLREMGGCLYLLVNDANNVDVWVMKEYGNKESWIKLFCFSDELDSWDMTIRGGCFESDGVRNPRGCVILGSLESVGCIEPIVYSKDKDGRRLFLVMICSSEFGWYDLDTEKLNYITSHDKQPRPILGTTSFVGSLVSLN